MSVGCWSCSILAPNQNGLVYPPCNAAVPCYFRPTLIAAEKRYRTNSRCAQMRERLSSCCEVLRIRQTGGWQRLRSSCRPEFVKKPVFLQSVNVALVDQILRPDFF